MTADPKPLSRPTPPARAATRPPPLHVPAGIVLLLALLLAATSTPPASGQKAPARPKALSKAPGLWVVTKVYRRSTIPNEEVAEHKEEKDAWDDANERMVPVKLSDGYYYTVYRRPFDESSKPRDASAVEIVRTPRPSGKTTTPAIPKPPAVPPIAGKTFTGTIGTVTVRMTFSGDGYTGKVTIANEKGTLTADWTQTASGLKITPENGDGFVFRATIRKDKLDGYLYRKNVSGLTDWSMTLQSPDRVEAPRKAVPPRKTEAPKKAQLPDSPNEKLEGSIWVKGPITLTFGKNGTASRKHSSDPKASPGVWKLTGTTIHGRFDISAYLRDEFEGTYSGGELKLRVRVVHTYSSGKVETSSFKPREGWVRTK